MESNYKVTNTALDPSKAMLHRRASKMQMEPTIAGKRLKLRSSITLNQHQMDVNKEFLEHLEKQGTVTVDWQVKTESLEEQRVLQECDAFIEDDVPQLSPEKPLVIIDDVGLPGVTAIIATPPVEVPKVPEKTPEIVSAPTNLMRPTPQQAQRDKGQQPYKKR